MMESTSSTPLTPAEAEIDEEQRMGGEGFGNIVMLMVIIGSLVVAGVIIFAMLALSGQFQNDLLRPPV